MGLALVLVLAQSRVPGDDTSKCRPVPDIMCAKMQALFQRHYPKATFTNRELNGLHFEYDVATFEFPPAEPTGKHENRIQRGPRKGGVLCSIYCEKGEYLGQIGLSPRGGGQYEPCLIDRIAYKQLLMAPYSSKRDAHLWVSLSYPSDTSDAFLREFHALMNEFQKDMHQPVQPHGPANGSQPSSPDSNRTSAAAGSRR